MAERKTRPGLRQRTPIAEWLAAGLGLILTLGMLGYLVREGLTDREGAPSLSVSHAAVEATSGGFVVPVTVRNASDVTAARVEIRGVLEQGGRTIEERRLSFTYVPGGGEAKGGLIFQNHPAGSRLKVFAEGYEEP